MLWWMPSVTLGAWAGTPRCLERAIAEARGDGGLERIGRPSEASVARQAPIDGAIEEGLRTLEVRWIVAGALEAETIEWLSPFLAEIESRRDAYLLTRRILDVAIKVRDHSRLDVKLYGGRPDALLLPGRVRGRPEWWTKWSFPIGDVRDETETTGWAMVQKLRRICYFDGDARELSSRSGRAHGTICAVELTDIHLEGDRWWTLGFEASGPGDQLRTAVEAAAERLLPSMPASGRLVSKDSRSYLAWLTQLRRSHGPSRGRDPA